MRPRSSVVYKSCMLNYGWKCNSRSQFIACYYSSIWYNCVTCLMRINKIRAHVIVGPSNLIIINWPRKIAFLAFLVLTIRIITRILQLGVLSVVLPSFRNTDLWNIENANTFSADPHCSFLYLLVPCYFWPLNQCNLQKGHHWSTSLHRFRIQRACSVSKKKSSC